jgi:hypothetical protein
MLIITVLFRSKLIFAPKKRIQQVCGITNSILEENNIKRRKTILHIN